MPAQEFLERVCTMHNLIWYYDGAALYICSSGEVVSQLLDLAYMKAGDVRAMLRELGVEDSRFPIKTANNDELIMVSGPPRYVELVLQMIEKADRLKQLRTFNEIETRIFPLVNTWADNVSFRSSDPESGAQIRGVAQILTDGKQFTTGYSPFRAIGQGSFLYLPMPIIITIVVVVAVALFTRKTAFGAFVESVGVNPSASRLSGIKAATVILIVFALTGLLSGIAGLIYSSRIMSNDSNNAGLNFEMDAILAVVIGGTNMAGGKFSLAGTVVGSLIIRTIVTFVYYFGIVSEATMAFKALIIAVVIVLQSEPVREYFAKRARIRAARLNGGAAA